MGKGSPLRPDPEAREQPQGLPQLRQGVEGEEGDQLDQGLHQPTRVEDKRHRPVEYA